MAVELTEAEFNAYSSSEFLKDLARNMDSLSSPLKNGRFDYFNVGKEKNVIDIFMGQKAITQKQGNKGLVSVFNLGLFKTKLAAAKARPPRWDSPEYWDNMDKEDARVEDQKKKQKKLLSENSELGKAFLKLLTDDRIVGIPPEYFDNDVENYASKLITFNNPSAEFEKGVLINISNSDDKYKQFINDEKLYFLYITGKLQKNEDTTLNEETLNALNALDETLSTYRNHTLQDPSQEDQVQEHLSMNAYVAEYRDHKLEYQELIKRLAMAVEKYIEKKHKIKSVEVFAHLVFFWMQTYLKDAKTALSDKNLEATEIPDVFLIMV
jgi:hypothetical protein